MARATAKILRIEGSLTAQSALHVGGVGGGLLSDMPLTRDGRNRLTIPGSSLAGAMRHWMTRHFPDQDELLAAFWGFQPAPKKPSKNDDGAASRLFVDDAPVSLPAGLGTELWDGVGIDRETGCAAPGIKFDRVVLPKGSRLRLQLSLELPADDGPAAAGLSALLGHLLQALQRGDIALGAAFTRGMGRIRLEDLRLWQEDWDSRDGLLNLLAGKHHPIDTENLLQQATLQPATHQQLRIDIDWHPDGPLMTRAGYDGIAVDALPMMSGDGPDRVVMILPGSALKGSLRSQAERIVRTVLGQFDAHWPGNRRERHRRQLDLPLIIDLFGTDKRPAADRDAGLPTSRWLGKSSLSVAACYAENAGCDSAQWQAIGSTVAEHDVPEGQSSQLYQALEQAGLSTADGVQFQQAFHVAVDRWTGAAAEHRLYSGIEPLNVAWQPLRLDIDLDRLAPELHGPVAALLWLMLRDLAAGRLAIGFGVNRGYGSMRVDCVRLRVQGGDPGELAWMDGLQLSGDELRQAPPCLHDELTRLQQDWRQWIAKTSKRVST